MNGSFRRAPPHPPETPSHRIPSKAASHLFYPYGFDPFKNFEAGGLSALFSGLIAGRS